MYIAIYIYICKYIEKSLAIMLYVFPKFLGIIKHMKSLLIIIV